MTALFVCGKEVKDQMHHYEISKEYAALAEEVLDEHEDLHWISQVGISIGFVEADWEKINATGEVLGDCRLVKEPYHIFCPFDFLITIYTPNVAHLTEEQKKILLYHELLHVDMSEKNGEPVYRTAPHDVQDFRKVIDQYGVRWAGD